MAIVHLTNPKSVSSMKLHQDLDITRKSAWNFAYRLRQVADVVFGLAGKQLRYEDLTADNGLSSGAQS